MQDHGRSKVLVIEQAENAREILVLLKYLGYEAESADCGYTGIIKALSFQPAFILCSTGLPRMNGFQVAEELRGRQETASTRLIALLDFSASTLEGLERLSCFDLHLFKPVTMAKLREVLETAHPPPRPRRPFLLALT
jgi:CheY-like chemotaxis protein